MPLSLFIFFFLGFQNLSFSIARDHESPNREMGSDLCPLNIDALRNLIVESSQRLAFLDVPTECQYMLQGLRLLRSEYLRTTGLFFPPPNASEACWDDYESLVDESIPGFGIRSTCGFGTSLMSRGCMNITTRSQFETLVPKSELDRIWGSCNQSLQNDSLCQSCVESLSSVLVSYLNDGSNGNALDCTGYPSIYAAAFVNPYGPTNLDTAKCLFSLDFTPKSEKSKRKKMVLWSVFGGCVTGIFGALGVAWILCRRHRKRKRRTSMTETEMGFGQNTTLVKLSFEEIKMATKNFARENIIGKGRYGNVYKGILQDGSEVALKRFKNCSAAGDGTFEHEVGVIASIRHVNLVVLRGYCTETMPSEGHQRIIICELVRNGSLFDHLFEPEREKLSWPIRRKIALGVARGLAYLHYGVKPSIIHRDVKASNILIDESFEPKLADFGLAKFTPEGFSHLSTRVAGTLGYVAPEYALYGQLSDKSDVYSFGVVLLELLSGKRAVIEADDVQTLLLTDWAWSLVKQGRALDIVEEGMLELSPPEEMEKYVLVAVISSHPVPQARPAIDRVVKMLEENFPAMPASSDGWSPSYISSSDVFEPFFSKSDHPMLDRLSNEESSSM